MQPLEASRTSVVIVSLVRNGMAYLPAYRKQLEALVCPLGLDWRLCILGGDSEDETMAFLQRWSEEDSRVKFGREDVGSGLSEKDLAERWARACNAVLDLIEAPGAHTHVLWLEADLCFPQDLLVRLLRHDVDIVAPVIWLGGSFYDTWGFRGLDRVRWSNEPPYHRDYRPFTLLEMTSVGSCVLFRRAIFDSGIRFRGPYETGLLVGVCLDAGQRGFRTWADTGTAVLHPVDAWERQLWKCRGIVFVDQRGNVVAERVPTAAERIGRVPVMDPQKIRIQCATVLTEAATRLGTNHLNVSVTTKPSTREFLLEVRAARQALLLGGVLRAANSLRIDQLRKGVGPGLYKAALRRVLHCDVQIRSEEQA